MIIAVVAITCGTALSILKMLLDHHAKSKSVKTSTGGGASSMTTSQLETMLERAVTRATEPLSDRLELIEAQMNTPQLPAAGERIALESGEEEAEPAMAVGRSRTR
ncbi:MAG: hypothetical protein JJ976_11810 [Rhodothermales bacterium]|nr:hypothetical protein [Rhodothermales bacterium]